MTTAAIRIAFAAACAAPIYFMSVQPSAAACYEEVYETPVLTCNPRHTGNSADFGANCAYVSPPPTQVEVACPGRWINVPSGNLNFTPYTQADICGSAGLRAGSVGGQVCASGERRPTSGEGYSSIAYRYGTWGGAGVGGTIAERTTQSSEVGCNDNCGGNSITLTMNWCWVPGQVRDHDATDLVVAYYCVP